MNTIPAVTSVSGCPSQSAVSTMDCDRRGRWYNLTITGQRFGIDGTPLDIYIGGVPCGYVVRLDSNTALCLQNFYNGSGLFRRTPLFFCLKGVNPDLCLACIGVYL